MKTFFILLISLIFLFSSAAYGDMGKKSCYLESGSQFENKMDIGSMSDSDRKLMEMHHHHLDKNKMMKKMEKNRDMIEKEYHSNDGNIFDDYL